MAPDISRGRSTPQSKIGKAIPLSERQDLPPAAKNLLYTPDTLPKAGNASSSMWAKAPRPPGQDFSWSTLEQPKPTLMEKKIFEKQHREANQKIAKWKENRRVRSNQTSHTDAVGEPMTSCPKSSAGVLLRTEATQSNAGQTGPAEKYVWPHEQPRGYYSQEDAPNPGSIEVTGSPRNEKGQTLRDSIHSPSAKPAASAAEPKAIEPKVIEAENAISRRNGSDFAICKINDLLSPHLKDSQVYMIGSRDDMNASSEFCNAQMRSNQDTPNPSNIEKLLQERDRSLATSFVPTGYNKSKQLTAASNSTKSKHSVQSDGSMNDGKRRQDQGWYDPALYEGELKRKWLHTQPTKVAEADIKSDKFLSGHHSLIPGDFVEPIVHPVTVPNFFFTDNRENQFSKTANAEIYEATGVPPIVGRVPENSSPLDTPEVRIREHIASNPPFAPTIPIYLRAAIQKDVPAIAQIYNQWIRNSTILEDNIDVSEEDINRLLLNARDCNQPFIVAINRENVPDITSEGTPADPFRFQNQGENIIGFSRAISSQGINGRMDGQSRFTVKVEVFVHQEYLHKGVGSCLMDAIMCCLCPNNPSYNGYRFLLVNLNSYDNNHEIYCKTGGEKKYHQVLIERSFEKFNDQNFVWISKFLRKFGFSEFYRAIGVRHVDQNDKIRFLDVVTFHREARPSIGFAH